MSASSDMTPGTPVPWLALDVAERDRCAWRAICDWPVHAGFDAVRQGLDWGILARPLLWDKAGRAIRSQQDPAAAAFEAELLREPLVGHGELASRLRWRTAAAAQARRMILSSKLSLQRALAKRRVLYSLIPYSRHGQAVEALLESDRMFEIVVPQEFAWRWPGAVPWACAVRGGPSREEDGVLGRELAGAIDRGMKARGICLLEPDRTRLVEQLSEQARTVRRAEAELARLHPDALLVPVDNHPPYIEYALVARRLGIPVIMLQHGLDCERYYLDDAQASHIAVWGPDRLERYRRDSLYQPVRVEVVGNPTYDVAARVQADAGDPLLWLWVTRPHRPEKCYPPSRRADEGLLILEALLHALDRTPGARLVIKPHSFDYEARYREVLAGRGDDRARVLWDTVPDLLKHAGVVISEDSTAGMDAMMSDRVLVHAHFATSAPVIPFADEGAALPGFSAAQLVESLARTAVLTASEREALSAGRRRFLDRFAGLRDGGGRRRFVAFVANVMGRSACP